MWHHIKKSSLFEKKSILSRKIKKIFFILFKVEEIKKIYIYLNINFLFSPQPNIISYLHKVMINFYPSHPHLEIRLIIRKYIFVINLFLIVMLDYLKISFLLILLFTIL